MLYLVGEWGFDSWQIFGIATSKEHAENIKRIAIEKGLASERLISIEEYEENTFKEE